MFKLANRYKLKPKIDYSVQSLIRCNNYSTSQFATQLRMQRSADSNVLHRRHCYLLTKYAPTMSLSSDVYQQSLLIMPTTIRNFHTSRCLYECNSSKVDETVKTLKNKQKEKVEEIMKEVANGACATDTKTDTVVAKETTTNVKPVTPKKSLSVRIWEELVHYYHGFRLLFIDIGVCARLIWRVLNGKTLTRRENKLLTRTSADIFRLIPFSIFIIVPFMELLLPVFIKFFPGMLPSTFQTDKDVENKLKQSLQVKLEMAKFLQRTLDEMPVQHKEHKSEEAKYFDTFFKKIKDPHAYVSNEDIIKFAKLFSDEITLDSLSREQLAALCRVLELNTIGTSNLLRFQLRLKLRSLSADDRVIAREGVNSLNLMELQQACKARGMRAYGLTEERLRSQLQEWIDLSLNEKVPPTLLLLSRTMHSLDDNITTDKLKKILSELPESAAQQTKAAIGECVGKIDNKTKIDVIKEEERKIREEREEEREERREIKAKLDAEKSEPIVQIPLHQKSPKEQPCDPSITSNDVQLLSDALKSLSSDNTMCVEKETIKEIKEELQEYKDDVEELNEVGKVIQEPIKERRAAQLLYKKVNNMIGQLDTVLTDLEKKKQQEIVKSDEETVAENGVLIDELVQTVRKLKESTDQSQFKELENLLSKLDGDKDGLITVNEVRTFVKTLPKNCPQIDEKLFSELITLLDKHAHKRRMEEVVRIDELIQNIKKLKETSDQARVKHIGNVLEKLDDDKDGVITVNEVLKVVESLGRENVNLTDKQIEEVINLMEKEQIMQAEEKIEKALAKSERDKAKQKEQTDNVTKMSMATDEFKDTAATLNDNAIDLDKLDKDKTKSTEKLVTPISIIPLDAIEKQNEKILPKSSEFGVETKTHEIGATTPPTIPATNTTITPGKDKRL